jgi:prevent-host-death family protein
VAQVVELSVDSKAGKIKIHRVVAAVDCGPVINPDPLVAQIEGAALFFLFLSNWFIKLVENRHRPWSTPMEKVSAFEAKTRLSELLRETERGREFIIFRRGKEVARLIPPRESGGEKRLQSLADEFRKFRKKVSGPVNIQELIDEGRRV